MVSDTAHGAPRGTEVIHLRGRQLAISRLADPQHEPTMVRAEDASGNAVKPLPNASTAVAARGAALCINDGKSVYELCG